VKAPRLFVHPYRRDSGGAPDWLSEDERRYWQSFGGDYRRSNFVASRALARAALVHCAGGRFSDWALTAPGVPQVVGASQWRLSISHSGDLALVGLWDRGAVGVDLEPLEPARRWRAVAQRWFHPAEIRWLDGQDDAQGVRDFYLLWTLKEAWIKATGRGIAEHLQSLRLDPATGGGWRVCGDLAGNWRCAAGWWRDCCLALVWQDGAEPAVPSLAEVGDPRHAPEAKTASVDWVIISEVIHEPA